MPPFRNYFSSKRPASTAGVEPNDENQRPGSKSADKTDVATEARASALSIKGTREEPNEYKMSGMSIRQNKCRSGSVLSHHTAIY